MTDGQQMSRRDWFRLRKPAVKPGELGTAAQRKLQPVERPPNHDGLDMSELPAVHEAILDAEQLAALLHDIEQCGQDVQLFAGRRAANTADQSAQLRLLKDDLWSGSIAKLQIRYGWQSQQWIDTLERKPDGIRLVRIGHG